MVKDLAKMFIWINSGFFLINAILIPFVPVPTINFICALVSLAGAMCSWQLYTQADEND